MKTKNNIGITELSEAVRPQEGHSREEVLRRSESLLKLQVPKYTNLSIF